MDRVFGIITGRFTRERNYGHSTGCESHLWTESLGSSLGGSPVNVTAVTLQAVKVTCGPSLRVCPEEHNGPSLNAG